MLESGLRGLLTWLLKLMLPIMLYILDWKGINTAIGLKEVANIDDLILEIVKHMKMSL